MKFLQKIQIKIQEHKKGVFLFSTFVFLVVVTVFAGVHFAHAGVEEYIQQAMFWLATVFLRLEGAVMQTLMTGFNSFMRYNTYFQEDFVLTGWGIVRDLVNLLFILVLMIIALMSILRVQESVVRHLLPRFVFAVLLVNFSFFFCRVVVGAADSLSHGFLDQASGLSTAVFNYVESFKSFELVSSNNPDLAWAAVTSAWLAVVFLLFVAIAILVVAACMLVRIVAICVLVVLSPFAFLALILPATAGLANKWLKNLFSYAFWGPAAIFFVWLSVITFVSKSSPLSTSLDLTSTPAVSASVNSVTGQLLKFVVVSIFLYIAIIAGKLLGNTGADLGMKAVGAAGKLAGKALSGLGTGIAAATGTRGLGKAFSKSFSEWAGRNSGAQGEAMSAALRARSLRGMYRAAVGRGTPKPKKPGQWFRRAGSTIAQERKNKEQAKRESEHQSNYEKMSGAQQQDAWAKLQGSTDNDAMEKKRALLRVAAKNGDLGKLLGDKAHLPDQIGGVLAAAGFKKEEVGKVRNDLASISDKSDHGDKRYAAISGFRDGEFQENNSQQYTEAITDHVDDKIEKGEGKKLSPRMFSDDEAGIAAIAGLKAGYDQNGNQLPINRSVKAAAWSKIQASSQGTGYHARAAAAAERELQRGGNGPVTFQLGRWGGGKKVTMSREQARKYVDNVNAARGVPVQGGAPAAAPAGAPAPAAPGGPAAGAGGGPVAPVAPPAGPPPRRGPAQNPNRNPNRRRP